MAGVIVAGSCQWTTIPEYVWHHRMARQVSVIPVFFFIQLYLVYLNIGIIKL
jgi:hypothetical protein